MVKVKNLEKLLATLSSCLANLEIYVWLHIYLCDIMLPFAATYCFRGLKKQRWCTTDNTDRGRATTMMIQLRCYALSIDWKLWSTESDSIANTQKGHRNTGMNLSKQKGEKRGESVTQRIWFHQQFPQLKQMYLKKLKNQKKNNKNLNKRERNKIL